MNGAVPLLLVTVMVPSAAPVQDSGVEEVLMLIPAPVLIKKVRVPVHPDASVIITLWLPPDSPVNTFVDCGAPPSNE